MIEWRRDGDGKNALAGKPPVAPGAHAAGLNGTGEPMAPQTATDLDFLAANVHGRRSRLAEGDRLEALCRLRTLPELARALMPEARFLTPSHLERVLVLDQVEELSTIASKVGGSSGHLLDWLRQRFRVENLKVLVRGFATGMALPDLKPYLVPLPDDLALDAEVLAGAGSIEAFAGVVDPEPLRAGLQQAVDLYRRQPRPFFPEAGLDQGYLAELLVRAGDLPRAHRGDVLEIARQEADTFHLALVSRGRFVYDLPAEMLAPFHVPGTRLGRPLFLKLLGADALGQVADRALGLVIDTLPDRVEPDASALEALAWSRYYRLANRTFRRSHMGLGAVVAYAAIRRIELANLITLIEGVRAHLPADAIRRRFIPRDVGSE